MAESRDLLIEIGTEELPPTSLLGLGTALEQELVTRLTTNELTSLSSRSFASPRRLGVLVTGVARRQPDRQHQRRGPAVSASFDDEGNPTAAAQGFARSCGVSVELLETLNSEKGSWLSYTSQEPGKDTADLLPDLIRQALEALPIPKPMRWGAGEEQFVRPVHWVVLLYGEQVIETEVLGQITGRDTYGHRFHHPGPLNIPEPDGYESLLETQGMVIPDFSARREAIRGQVTEAAKACGGEPDLDPQLLDEVTALVEWPIAVTGRFDPGFLAIPHEALVSTMQGNQKYFPVRDARGQLLPSFITVSNIDSADPEVVSRGNERVIKPRFADAEFFWNQDRKRTLGDRLVDLRAVTFEKELGTLHDKTMRMIDLAGSIGGALGYEPDSCRRTAELAKCDLVTQMVYEFPELQGVMGGYYARHDGEAEGVAEGIEEQYLPRFGGGTLPRTETGITVALADRIDTLVGIFAVGKHPTGTKDPFALRRAALAVMRILVERALPLDLHALITQATALLPQAVRTRADPNELFEFAFDRLQPYYAEQGFRSDEFEAVRARRPTLPMDFDRRLRAVASFRKLDEAESLEAANKRIRNILRKAPDTVPEHIEAGLLVTEAEQALATAIAERSAQVEPLMGAGDYAAALIRLAPLRPAVDTFFDEVMVMVDDPALRRNRLALLQRLEGLFLRVADFSRLQH